MVLIKKSYTHTSTVSIKTIFNFIILLVLFWILSRPLKGLGENIYYLAGTVVNEAFHNISESKSNIQGLIRAKDLLEEQDKTITSLKIRLSSLESEVSETDKLISLLKAKKNLNYKTFSATVIGRGTDNWHKQIIINKGNQENIMIGDSVLSHKGIVGQVIEVNNNHSIVQLISDPAFKVGCKISDKNVIGILSGKTNLTGLLEFIPIGTNIRTGDKVTTSGIAASGLFPTYPPGYPVGIISRISKKKNKASDLYVEVKLLENLTTLSDVLVFSPS